MRSSRSVQRLSLSAVGTAVSGLAGAIIMAGCQPAPNPMAPPPPPPVVPSADQAMSMQQQIHAVDPNAKVGHVASADASNHLAAVAGIAFADVQVGLPVSFVGADQHPIANGTITALDNHTAPGYSFLMVSYEKVPGGRDPQSNDVAIVVPMAH